MNAQPHEMAAVESLLAFWRDAGVDACYLDAAGMNTFTSMIRLGVAGFIMTGEWLFTSEWDKSSGRPLKTCFQMVDPSRLRNQDWQSDTADLRAS